MVLEHNLLWDLQRIEPPTMAQCVEQLEEKATNIEAIMAEMLSYAVERAMDAMRYTLTELVMESQAANAKIMGAEFEAMSGRLEERIARSRESKSR